MRESADCEMTDKVRQGKPYKITEHKVTNNGQSEWVKVSAPIVLSEQKAVATSYQVVTALTAGGMMGIGKN